MSDKHTETIAEHDVHGRATASPESETDDPPDALGVLLVHGIGTQRRGDMLRQAGDALYDWLRAWLRMDIQLVDSDISPTVDDSNTPAQARLVFPSSEEHGSSSWLLAECHWADTFRGRAYSEFVSWAWQIVPYAVLLHLVPRIKPAWELFFDGVVSTRDAKQVQWRTLGSVIASSLSVVVLAIAGVMLIILLSLVRALSFLLPFDAIRQFLKVTSLLEM